MTRVSGADSLIYFFLGILLIVLETTLLQSFPAWIGRPDFVYILVAFTAYRFAWIPGLLLTFSLGWMMDALTGINLGVYPLECLAVFASLKALTTNNPLREIDLSDTSGRPQLFYRAAGAVFSLFLHSS